MNRRNGYSMIAFAASGSTFPSAGPDYQGVALDPFGVTVFRDIRSLQPARRENAEVRSSEAQVAKTFTELGIPFPLFEGPSDQAGEYCGVGTCSLCESTGQHCFGMGIGCAVMVKCPSCGIANALDAADREDGSCRQCGVAMSFPAIDDEEVKACYSCLRSGKAAITKDTELGMVSWEQAFEGVTHGVPGLNRPDFEMVPKGDDWVGARLPQEIMLELLRTPTYNSIQGERWQFCCRRPMVFIGELSREEFVRRAPDGNGQRYFEQIVQDTVSSLWEDELHDITGVYAFQCPSCGRLTAHWDIA
jgi:uncharacterized protein CbrC (UPF0167 family)